MKLYELIRLRNELKQALEISILQSEIEKNCSRLQNLAEDTDPDIFDSLQLLVENHNNINTLYDRDVAHLSQLIDNIQAKINSLAEKFFAENYQLELEYLNSEFVRSTRQIRSDEEFETVLTQRINLHSGWQYPALEIGCRDGAWTKLLVASDPLYVADLFEEFLDSAVKQFTPIYQGRIRRYLIHDFFTIKNLPKNQFGFIFSYNFFNYLSLDSIKQFLIQSMDWLRPGGTIIFTYNNADLPAAAAYAESYFMTYVPKSILIPMAESLGYETVFSYDNDPAFSIVEFKKPGELKSIKVGQTIGEIKIIPD